MIFDYQVVRFGNGWAYRLDRTYSRIFVTEPEAVEAAKAAAVHMHEAGDRTQVRSQHASLEWRVELVIDGSEGRGVAHAKPSIVSSR